MGETNETLMHVASMLHLSLPEDAGPDFLTDLVGALRTLARSSRRGTCGCRPAC